MQMAFAYFGFCLMPPLFGFIADALSMALLPLYFLLLMLVMALTHEVMIRQTSKKTTPMEDNRC